MPKWPSELLKHLPFKKLSRHDMTNLVFDFVAAFYTLSFTRRITNELLAASTWLMVMVLCLVCFFWSSKQ
jgi:hypothetical protein